MPRCGSVQSMELCPLNVTRHQTAAAQSIRRMHKALKLPAAQAHG
jgi:hypothetical protein